jgi:hypothetical protein
MKTTTKARPVMKDANHRLANINTVMHSRNAVVDLGRAMENLRKIDLRTVKGVERECIKQAREAILSVQDLLDF